jgi:beta-lactamase superfamily II metal-dependent hydrolase
LGIEIEFLPVGENTKNGDAIVVRYGVEDNYTIMVVDGGHKESGEKIVSHIKKYYGTTYVDYVVNTHPDSDHVSGLITVLNELQVGKLYMHLPWEDSTVIRDLFKDGRITDSSLEDRIKNSLNKAYELYELAQELEIPVEEPFEGTTIGQFTVLSPDEEWYTNDLLPEFPNMPQKKEQSLMQKSLSEAYAKVLEWIDETWDKETLSENYESTGARNESSVVMFGDIDGTKVLLTGDAGKDSLTRASYYAESQQIDLKQCSFIQAPHHGSRRNVSPSVLNKIIGEKVVEGSSANKSAYISVAKLSKDHPKKVVVNAFIRRGAKVYKTQGKTIRYHKNMPEREGWVALTPMEFSIKVED